MKIRTLTATALLSAGAVATVTGSAYAQPLWVDHSQVQQAADVMRGEDRGVAVNEDLSDAVSVRDAASFDLTDGGQAFGATTEDGTVFDAMPLGDQAAGQTFDLAPQTEHDGAGLNLTPVGLSGIDQAQQVDLLHSVDYPADMARHQYNAGVGALIGAGVGALIGFPFAVVGAIPGAIVGALAGAAIGWVQP
ncbi:hypothetical protein [Nocardia iowensis]|uniref:Glycine zipper family protein n=1 Tax=Nocardia iowensis TaxID=204891 RepID=A0ABX8RIG6_NOCIO|nr:hypothetical protein [Nocardia iowensis]QXN88699.1 hypothetical protein KV110_24250 [Nocardia iowensis]